MPFLLFMVNAITSCPRLTSTGAINLNWAEQPEDLGCYLMQDKYEQLYNGII